jgi:hypothetical protein
MNSYTLKNWLWVVIISLFVIIALLTGCSSAPKQTAGQYCHTSQEIRLKDNERVSSETLVKCNDDPVERVVIKRAGIAQNCGEYTYWMTLNGKPVERKAISCQKWNGTWEIIPTVAN